MKKLENMITDAMGLIENVANEVENDLASGIEFIEDEPWVGSYELDEQIFNAFKEEAIADYFADYLSDEIEKIEEENGVLCEVYIEDDCLVVYFSNNSNGLKNMEKKLDLMEHYSIHIMSLAKNENKQAFNHLVKVPTSMVENIDMLECTLDYPLNQTHTFQIPLEKYNRGKYTTIYTDYICVAIAKEYQMLWRKHNKWFWGHHWGDLYIEGLELRGNVLNVFVGS